WGPILMVGLGGIWVEALGDVQLLAPDLPRAAIIERLRRLKAAKLLDGFRGAPPIDLDAVADVIALLGQLMLQYPEVTEVDINPLVAYGRGQGVVALDALIVTQ
ncbi:acetate--CoA ligase family protein, partial [Bradyrhizobium sp.]